MGFELLFSAVVDYRRFEEDDPYLPKFSMSRINYDQIFSEIGLNASKKLLHSLGSLERKIGDVHQMFSEEAIRTLSVQTPFFPWGYVPLAWAEFDHIIMLEVSANGKFLKDRFLIYEPIENYLFVALDGEGILKADLLVEYREANLFVPNEKACPRSEILVDGGTYKLGEFSVMRNGHVFSVRNTDFERPEISFTGPVGYRGCLDVISMFQSSFWEDVASAYLNEGDLVRARRCYMNAVEVILCSDDRSGYETSSEQGKRIKHLVSQCEKHTRNVCGIYDIWFFNSIFVVAEAWEEL